MEGGNGVNEPINFAPLSADAREKPVEMESLCVQCEENGTTTMLFTSIPHFKEVVLMSFACPHCGNRNNEIQFAGAFGDQGVKLSLSVEDGATDVLSRQVVKSDACTLKVPELDFEVPANTQKGKLSTVEGFLRKSAENLLALQEVRRRTDPDVAKKIDSFCEKLLLCAEAKMPFTLELDDPSGNSFIEPGGTLLEDDPLLKVEKYERTLEQSRGLGLAVKETIEKEPEIGPDDPFHGKNARGIATNIDGDATALMGRMGAPEEVMVMEGNCVACGAEAETKMFATAIPHFKEVIIMSTQCEACGYKNSDVRSGGAISERGRMVTLKVQELTDLQRDVIKAETAAVLVPEIDLEITRGSLGSLITTVEGVLQRVKRELGKMLSFQMGDAADEVSRETVAKFSEKLNSYSELKEPWTLILKDPLANSYIAPICEDSSMDDRLSVEEYDRSPEEEDDFGIADLKKYAGVGETIP